MTNRIDPLINRAPATEKNADLDDSCRDQPLLEILGIKKNFSVQRGLFSAKTAQVPALNGVSLNVYRGETLGLVGESGCGKSTLGRLVMRLDEPTEGRILFHGRNIFDFDRRSTKEYCKRVQLIFQDHQASLNPRRTAGRAVAEPLKIHGAVPSGQIRERVAQILDTVGLSPDQMNRYPHEFSGGQRQRIGIARAIALRPELVIADEPVSSLDVSIQAQILNLLKNLQQSFGLTYLFITHDLGVVRHMSDRIAVMTLGRIVELADNRELCAHPLHPYTRALFAAVPVPDPRRRSNRSFLKGDPSGAGAGIPGCPFFERCPERMERCRKFTPQWAEKSRNHFVACHL